MVGHMRSLVLLCLALGVAGAALAWPGATRQRTHCSLAVAPVALGLTRLDPVTAGQAFRIQLDAEARADCNDVTLEVELPAGASLVSGAASWHGALAKGERRQSVVTVSVPDTQPRSFIAVASVRRGSALLVKQFALQVNTPGLRVQKARALPSVTARDGTRMLVLPAREVAR